MPGLACGQDPAIQLLILLVERADLARLLQELLKGESTAQRRMRLTIERAIGVPQSSDS